MPGLAAWALVTALAWLETPTAPDHAVDPERALRPGLARRTPRARRPRRPAMAEASDAGGDQLPDAHEDVQEAGRTRRDREAGDADELPQVDDDAQDKLDALDDMLDDPEVTDALLEKMGET